MADSDAQTKMAVSGLLMQSEQQLYVELARRSHSMKNNPALSGSYSLPESANLDMAINVADLQSFGQQFFQRVNVQAYGVMCGSAAQDNQDRQSVANAFSLDQAAVGATLSGVLVAQLGLAPLIATAVAALIIRLFFKPAYDEMCAFWKSKLPMPAASSG